MKVFLRGFEYVFEMVGLVATLMMRNFEKEGHTGSHLQRVWLQGALDYSEQISMHRPPCIKITLCLLKSSLQRVLAYSEQFLLHLITC